MIKPQDPHATASIEELLTQRSHAAIERDRAAREIWNIEEAIKAKMSAEGIKDLGHPEWDVTYTEGPSTYNKGRLMAELPELVPPDAYAKAYTPAWVEHREIPHAPDVNMTQVKPLGRFSKHVSDLIEECRTPGEPILRIRRNKTAADDLPW
jgi:hypothetical protein